MNSGRLRHRIIIQTGTDTLDDYGQSSFAWATFATVWADVRNVKGYEEVQADQVVLKNTHTIKIRFLASITTKMRILWGTRIFEITEINSDRTDAKSLMIGGKELIK